MKNRDFIDIGRIMDEIFEAAEDFTNAFTEGVHFRPGKGFKWGERRDFYPMYSYPPANVYMTDSKELVFEFALAGFREEDINLEFRGEYMFFSANPPKEFEDPGSVQYFKRRLKFKSIHEQKYYVPEDKFNREDVKAVFKNGILKVTVPPHEEVKTQEGVKIEIEKDQPDGGGSSSKAKGKSNKEEEK
jgi:molecular chaperone IbpB/HSP20 family protein